MARDTAREIWERIQRLLFWRQYSSVSRDKQEAESTAVDSRRPPLSFSFFLGSKVHSQLKTEPQVEEDNVVLAERQSNDDITALTDDLMRPRKRKWIDGVYLCAQGSAVFLLINLVFISVAAGLAGKFPDQREFANGSVIYEGNCALTKRWSIALHLVINILSTCILAASNYCMQTLVAPNREDLDKVHAQRKWLDIGCASVRNLFAIGHCRFGLWVMLLLTATPFHLLYNSILFDDLAMDEFGYMIAPSDLSPDNIRNLTTPRLNKCFQYSQYQMISDGFEGPPTPDTPVASLTTNSRTANGLDWQNFVSIIEGARYKQISSEKCVGYLDQSNPVGIKSLVALATDLSVQDGAEKAFLTTDISVGIDGVVASQEFPSSHKISGYPMFEGDRDTCGSSEEKDHVFSGCLEIPADGHCKLMYSPPICIVIMLSAFVKVIAMFFAARVTTLRSTPLLTTGDAVASFVAEPDQTTAGMCWLSRSAVKRGDWKRLNPPAQNSQTYEDQSQTAIPKPLSGRQFWIQVPGVTRWLITIIICLGFIAAGAYLVQRSVVTGSWTAYENGYLSQALLQQWWNNIASGVSLDIDAPGLKLSTLASVVVANTPQLALTISYYCYNNVLTGMLAAAEYSSYGQSSKPLRVTWPVNGSKQKSTYWLSIPYQYAIPILIIFSILHWLVSQSIFYTILTPYNTEGQPDYSNQVTALQYSPLPLFVAVLVGGLMVLILVGLSLRKFKSNIPLAGSCSAAISASCHPPHDESLDTAILGHVEWGEVVGSPDWAVGHSGYENQWGHCSFSSLDTRRPSRAKLYA
ncbi:hypothetical protein N7532_011295 [Penicillium argentinense]|uniref:DUF6536 domain-containing protein n=1 Tax=Penicillium argentinense TaxID=1131581 RepID=A0A9W9EIA2_9EURO|nr:uncharacterized protein N7532_011295 [Penicillium argentinense]KAJ5082252.1 hypothetical protein N7532_011295 [Penicillium argentinense]